MQGAFSSDPQDAGYSDIMLAINQKERFDNKDPRLAVYTKS